jgi:hypothetical protein
MPKKYKTEFVHDLSSPIEYACGGQLLKAKSIQVKCPSFAQMDDLSVLEQEFCKGQMNIVLKLSEMQSKVNMPQQAAQAEKDEDEASLGLVSSLGANGFNLPLAYQKLQLLLTSDKNPAMVDGREKITPLLFEQLSPLDARMLLGKYLANFINFSR